jgi:hypothetical protein
VVARFASAREGWAGKIVINIVGLRKDAKPKECAKKRDYTSLPVRMNVDYWTRCSRTRLD